MPGSFPIDEGSFAELITPGEFNIEPTYELRYPCPSQDEEPQNKEPIKIGNPASLIPEIQSPKSILKKQLTGWPSNPREPMPGVRPRQRNVRFNEPLAHFTPPRKVPLPTRLRVSSDNSRVYKAPLVTSLMKYRDWMRSMFGHLPLY
jgi:hypothetical protein